MIPGLDGQKMSKSYDNTLEIFAPEKYAQEKGDEDRHRLHARWRTPRTRTSATSSPWSACLWTRQEKAALAERYRAGGLGYGEVKKELFARMWEYFAPYRAKREPSWPANLDYVREIMAKGADKTRAVAVDTLDLVRSRVGLNY